MSDIARTLILCGILSGTQPVTLMGLLLIMSPGTSGPAKSTRKGIAYLAGALVVETGVLFLSAMLAGNTVSGFSIGGKVFFTIRLTLGVALIFFGARLRKPPKKPAPEVPKTLQRLQGLSPGKAFVAGMTLADYQGPFVASLALATATVGTGGRLAAWGLYTLFATGIPVLLFVVTLRSQKALQKMNNATGWVMSHRRVIGSWFCLVAGVLLVADAIMSWVAFGSH
jgi:hypothetical protein